MNKQEEQDYLQNIKAKLDKASDELDEKTLRKLQSVRQQAIAQLPNSASITKKHDVLTAIFSSWGQWILPGSVVAATAIVSVLVFSVSTPTSTDVAENTLFTNLEDMEVLGSEDELELFQDLEFLQWIANEKDLG